MQASSVYDRHHDKKPRKKVGLKPVVATLGSAPTTAVAPPEPAATLGSATTTTVAPPQTLATLGSATTTAVAPPATPALLSPSKKKPMSQKRKRGLKPTSGTGLAKQKRPSLSVPRHRAALPTQPRRALRQPNQKHSTAPKTTSTAATSLPTQQRRPAPEPKPSTGNALKVTPTATTSSRALQRRAARPAKPKRRAEHAPKSKTVAAPKPVSTAAGSDTQSTAPLQHAVRAAAVAVRAVTTVVSNNTQDDDGSSNTGQNGGYRRRTARKSTQPAGRRTARKSMQTATSSVGLTPRVRITPNYRVFDTSATTSTTTATVATTSTTTATVATTSTTTATVADADDSSSPHQWYMPLGQRKQRRKANEHNTLLSTDSNSDVDSDCNVSDSAGSSSSEDDNDVDDSDRSFDTNDVDACVDFIENDTVRAAVPPALDDTAIAAMVKDAEERAKKSFESSVDRLIERRYVTYREHEDDNSNSDADTAETQFEARDARSNVYFRDIVATPVTAAALRGRSPNDPVRISPYAAKKMKSAISQLYRFLRVVPDIARTVQFQQNGFPTQLTAVHLQQWVRFMLLRTDRPGREQYPGLKKATVMYHCRNNIVELFNHMRVRIPSRARTIMKLEIQVSYIYSLSFSVNSS